MVHGAPLWANTCRDVEHIVVPRDIIGSIRTSVVQHSRVMRPVAARLMRSNWPPEANAVLLPGSNRLGRRAAHPATAFLRRELVASRQGPLAYPVGAAADALINPYLSFPMPKFS